MFDKELNRLKKKTESEIDKIIEAIAKYNTIDFIENVSALMLIPQNQSKAIIFQAMINAALTLPIEKTKLDIKMSITTFKKIVKEFEKSSVRSMVDPPEFPFILPVLYYNNPYVFMGNNSLSPIYLNNLLKTIEINRKKINDETYYSLKRIIDGLLNISDRIRKEINIDFKELKFYSVEDAIFIPDKNTLDNYKEKLVISSDDIITIFGDKVNNYVMEFGLLDQKDILNEGNPEYIFKPFIKHKDNYLLIDVTCILPLIFKTIISDSISIDSLSIIDEYNSINSFELRKRFFMIGCQELVPDNIEMIKSRDYEENIFLLGNDRIIISIQLFDIGDDFDKEDNDVLFDRDDDFIFKRITYITECMVSKGIDEKNIFIIVSPYTLGRTFMYSLKDCDPNNILILSLYELYSISINEENNKYFLQEYIDTRKRLKEYRKNLFSELNMIALFTLKDNSFYSSDDVDVKEVYLSIIGEYSSDYILKSYLRESKKLCSFYKENTLIEVIKIENSIYFAPQLFFEKILNKVVIDKESTIWIINDGTTIEEYNLFQWISDLISYWLSELMPFQNDNYNITIKLIIDEKLKDGIRQMDINDDISSIMEYEIDHNMIKIYVTEKFCNYFNSDSNDKEKRFIKYLIEIMKDNYYTEYEETKFEQIFHNPYRKKTISIDSIYGAYMIPSNNKEQHQVSKAYENIILDDIGLYLKNIKNYNYGVIDDDKVLVYVVDYLYERLFNDLKEYSKQDLLCYLYEVYENNLGNMLIRQNNYAYDVTCYPDRKKEIENNINEMTKLSVALRFLIELISSFKECGIKKVSFYDINKDIVISSQIIEWAYAGDLLHYNMISSDITLLESNRIGFDKTSSNRINLLMKKTMIAKNSVVGLEKSKRLRVFLQKIEEKNDAFEVAFNEEFGYSYDDYTEVTVTILELFGKNYDNLIKIKSDDVLNNTQKDISKEVIIKIMDSLSLESRDNFLKPPLPYDAEEVYPWRFNRRLSLTRKPLIKLADEYIIGYRTLINSVHFLLDLINDGRLKSNSKTMKDYESIRNTIKGKQFNEQVYHFILSIDSLIVKKNIKKINKKYISDESNNTLGDIDVLYISTKKKIIGVVETKNFNMSKNYYEIQNEYKKMFDQSNPKCFYNKHKKRVKWIEEHLSDVIEEYNLPKGKWKIKDMFIVEDYIISKKVFNVKVNIHTLRDLNEKILLR